MIDAIDRSAERASSRAAQEDVYPRVLCGEGAIPFDLADHLAFEELQRRL